MAQLDNKIAIVTGAASGIGLATALKFLDEGACVLAADRTPVPETLAGHSCCHAVPLDLCIAGATDRVVAACIEAFGRVDILVNNAGIGNARPIEETSDDDFERYFAINLKVPFQLSRLVIGQMRRQGQGGTITNMSSVFGIMGAARTSGYAPTKAAMVGLTMQLAAEYGRDGIRVNAIAPGAIETPITRERIHGNPWYRRMMIEGSPMGRTGTADEVASACLFLASEASSFITGVTLPVDGGWTTTKFMPEPL
ncbi:SDR family NAD(P)-dependent oxidoreductase [Salinicola peritrichatus]|uniref:SDR family NAD(P)-dependent oxidoreductase n=1 Tax=Salinicola peritrichatus TaxID=1267424 RepID=UPI000DA16459|nr:SDR family oxidoreductase [Salinicola peritrichatus]